MSPEPETNLGAKYQNNIHTMVAPVLEVVGGGEEWGWRRRGEGRGEGGAAGVKGGGRV